MRDIAEVSIENSFSGLYITPDIWFFGMHLSTRDLTEDVQTIIHTKQPLTSSYAAFGNKLYEHFHDSASYKKMFDYSEYLMTMGSLGLSQQQIDHALTTIVEIGIAIHMKTINSPDNAKYPRIIPHELESMRFDAAWKINREAFRQMLLAEPWASWVGLMRGQLERNRAIISTNTMTDGLKHFHHKTVINKELLALERQGREEEFDRHRPNAKLAIKRAIKLHEKLYGLDDIRTLMRGKPVIIKGRQYDYHLTFTKDRLLHQTIHRDSRMSPTRFQIRNKANDILGTACLYFEDTAVLDYLINVKLYASNPESELDMIRGAHMTGVTRDFYRDPILPELKGIVDPVTAPLLTTDNIMRHASTDTEQMTRKRIMVGPLYAEGKAALQEVLQFPKGYSTMLKKCTRFNVWSFIREGSEAFSVIDGNLNDGLFQD